MVDGTILKDFRTEYAKSGAAKCRTCEEKIGKVSSPSVYALKTFNLHR